MANVTIVADWSAYGTVAGNVLLQPPSGPPTVVPIVSSAISTTVPANTSGVTLLYGISFSDMMIGTQAAVAMHPATIFIPATAQTIDLLTAISPPPIPVARTIFDGGSAPDPTSIAVGQISDALPYARDFLTNADNAADARAYLGAPAGAVYATMAALKAATVSTTGFARVQGYYSAGDGGGGFFRWDSTDTTSTDNGGTIITPTGGLSSSGRWKRVYEGEVNARWFGVNPSQSDNTGALQKCVTWAATTVPCLGVFIPGGDYPFTFDAGSSGLTTITINADNVLIRGEGKATQLTVNSHARPNQLNYFFTFSRGGNNRGQGGGVKDIHFNGHSMLKWGIYLGTWRNAEFHNISGYDMHVGILDAEVTSTTLYGEDISVKHIDHAATAGTVLTQYGVRFRGGTGTGAKTWTDCWIDNLDIILCWDSGVVLDGVQRFTVRNVVAANNGTFTDTIDGSSKSGCICAVQITRSSTLDIADVSGFHIIDGVYLESGQGSETPANNNAVLIHQLNIAFQIQWNHITNVRTNGNVGLLKLADDSGFGRLNNTTFTGNRNPISGNITIGAGVDQTDLILTPNDGRAWDTLISDSGTNTRVNGASPLGLTLRPPPAVYDSFTAANSSSPDSTKWNNSVGAGSGASVNVQGNTMQLKTGATGGYSSTDFVTLSSTLATTLVDVEVEFCLIFSTVAVESYFFVGLRSANVVPTSGASAYYLMVDGTGTATVVKRVSSSNTNLYNGPGVTTVNGDRTRFRFRVKGTKLMLWRWVDGDPIPTKPIWTGTDSSVAGGGLVTFAHGGGNAAASGIQKIDNAAVYAL